MVKTESLLAFAAMSLVVIAIPGPSVLFVVGRALAHGRGTALATVLGNLLGCYALVLAVALGGALVQSSTTVFTAVKLAGAVFLVYLGRTVLGCAEGQSNQQVATELGTWPQTVGKWRRRFLELCLDGLGDEARPGAPRKISDEQGEAVVVATLERTPKDATHWSRASMAAESGLSKSTVGRRSGGPSVSSRTRWTPSSCPTIRSQLRAEEAARAAFTSPESEAVMADIVRWHRPHPHPVPRSLVHLLGPHRTQVK